MWKAALLFVALVLVFDGLPIFRAEYGRRSSEWGERARFNANERHLAQEYPTFMTRVVQETAEFVSSSPFWHSLHHTALHMSSSQLVMRSATAAGDFLHSSLVRRFLSPQGWVELGVFGALWLAAVYGAYMLASSYFLIVGRTTVQVEAQRTKAAKAAAKASVAIATAAGTPAENSRRAIIDEAFAKHAALAAEFGPAPARTATIN